MQNDDDVSENNFANDGREEEKKEEACDIDEEQSGTGGRTMQESDEEIFEQLQENWNWRIGNDKQILWR